MLRPAAGLTDTELNAVADLEQQVLAHDGGRLKLEWGVLRQRPGHRVDDLLWWDDAGHLTGFLGIYGFGPPAVELTGMVHPQARRGGIATALLDAALPLCRDRGYTTALLVTPRTPPAAAHLARRRGGVLEHSEYALQLDGPVTDGPSDPHIVLRTATTDDTELVNDLLMAGFGWRPPEPDDTARADRDRAQTLMVERNGVSVGTLRVNAEQGTTGISGFVVHPDHQGQGVGRDVLRRVCRQALADGAQKVHLEVNAQNDRALGLYTSLGFTPVATEDYYSLPLPA